jgi:hypothetical protein
VPPALGGVLFERTSALRAEHGLPALALDTRLALRAKRYVHQLAATAAAAPDLADPRRGAALVAVARGSDEEALWADLERGVQRAKLLNPDVTHVGIAVDAVGSQLIATEVLMQLPLAVDIELATARVLAALNQNRHARGAPSLRPDSDLARLARQTAHQLFEHPEQSEREVVQRIDARLYPLGLAYRRLAAMAIWVRDPLEAAALEPALDGEARAAGVAVERGERPGVDPGQMAVVLVLGWQR